MVCRCSVQGIPEVPSSLQSPKPGLLTNLDSPTLNSTKQGPPAPTELCSSFP